jgi:hypothetical protein
LLHKTCPSLSALSLAINLIIMMKFVLVFLALASLAAADCPVPTYAPCAGATPMTINSLTLNACPWIGHTLQASELD